MPIPNLLIVGCQKCGTSWTHETLQKSRHIFASQTKELNFFVKTEENRSWAEYLNQFPEKPGASYYMESTPHYFQLPSNGHDIAGNIHRALGHPKLVVIFRNPVDRYESAYTHNMDKNRLPYIPKIIEFSNSHKMLELGKYGSILKHWKSYFPDMGTFFYDDLKEDKVKFISKIMSFIEIDNDIMSDVVNHRSNNKIYKARHNHPNWKTIPVLSSDVAERLQNYYHDEILMLEEITGRDLSSWRTPRKTRFLHDTVGPAVAKYIRRAVKGRWI